MIFGEKILDYWDDILKDLSTMIAIPSIAREQEGPHPYGDAAAKAIDAAMGMAEKYGLKAKNVDYYAMHAEYGKGEENAVVMAHVDVVPAGEGWATDPFEMIEKDGKIYGRGVEDDKGSAIVALHCLRALKDANVQGKRKLRVILGSGEEIGMDDMVHYFEHEQHPDMGFTPDANYGICNCEKGHLDLNIKTLNNNKLIKRFKAGTVPNAVPFKAECEIRCSSDEKASLENAAKSAEGDFEIKPINDRVYILSKGVAAHASTPEKGINAASNLALLLLKAFGSERVGNFITFIGEKIGATSDGSLIGVNKCDEESGALTFNLGIVNIDENECSLRIDIRYPVSAKGQQISDVIEKAASSYELDYKLDSDSIPLYVPRDGKLVTILSGAYEDVTGNKCDIYSMGGGTYARSMFNKGVAFGPGFPEHPDGGPHIANEFVYLENLKKHAIICLEAMYRMLTAD